MSFISGTVTLPAKVKSYELAMKDRITVERLPDLFERAFYPVKTPFSKTYLIRFIRGAGHEDGFTGERSGELALRFAGPLGINDLRWSNRP